MCGCLQSLKSSCLVWEIKAGGAEIPKQRATAVMIARTAQASKKIILLSHFSRSSVTSGFLREEHKLSCSLLEWRKKMKRIAEVQFP